MNYLKTIFCLLAFLISYQLCAKEDCQEYFEKLQHIQLLQKTKHSASTSVSLHKREQEAFDKWQACKKGKLNTKTSNKKAKPSLEEAQRQKQEKIVKLMPGSAFSSKKDIVLKGKYQGAMQQAWLDYYKQPDHCYTPKNTQVFAQCMEDRIRQQALFEVAYAELLKEQGQ